MLSRTQQAFLQKKIMELEQALFFNYSRSVLKLPTSLINALHVDDIGQVWFMLKRLPPARCRQILHRDRAGRDQFRRAALPRHPSETNNRYDPHPHGSGGDILLPSQ